MKTVLKTPHGVVMKDFARDIQQIVMMENVPAMQTAEMECAVPFGVTAKLIQILIVQ